MPPFLILALTLAAANPDLPIGRDTVIAPPPQAPPAAATPARPASAPASARAAATADAPSPSLAPTDDYGYVAFCYGAESSYVGLYDQVMPQVDRIERAFPGPTPIDQALAEYPQLRAASQVNIATYAKALSAAEAASAQPLAQSGVQSIELGRSIWDQVAKAAPAAAAEAWMGWSPEDDCATRADALIQRSKALASAPRGSGAVELDRLAAPVLTAAATAPAASIQTAAGAAPAPPAASAPSAPPISFGAEPLSIDFAAAAPAAGAATSVPQPALPSGLPLLTTPPATAAAEPAPWRGVL